MTGPEHYCEAERLITQANEALRDQSADSEARMMAHRMLIDTAQVHATLALAAATTGRGVHGTEWAEVLQP